MTTDTRVETLEKGADKADDGLAVTLPDQTPGEDGPSRAMVPATDPKAVPQAPATPAPAPAPAPAPGLLARLTTLWRDITWVRGAPTMETLGPSLVDAELEAVRRQLNDCLEGKGGEVSARARAAALGRAYLNFNAEGRLRFLTLLACEFATNHQAVALAAAEMSAANATGDMARMEAAEEGLRQALVAPRRDLLTQFNALPEGVKFLVDMRAELLRHIKDHPELKGLERDLRDLLRGWFDVGFLNLVSLSWNSPAAFLEKIISYEAVHAIQSWEDLKNRLDRDRRLYAFVHPRMPQEPLIFVEVALVNGIAENIHDLLDLDAPVLDPTKADTAIFYSITNAQSGLAGISFGNFLIKRVVEELRQEFPGLKTFSTLSPVPGFRKWLDARLAEGDSALLLPAERKAMRGLTANKGGAKGLLKEWVNDAGWLEDPKREEVLKPVLMRLCARYLAKEQRPARKEEHMPVRALDPVAHFHLTNGARMERLNWRGDISRKGLEQSAGMMINYLYKLDDIEKNHESYQDTGTAPMSSGFRSLVRG